MTIRLVVRVPRGATTDVSEHSFTRREVVVGRSPDCDLVLPGDEVRVSRQHVKIVRERDAYHMHDLGSRNGTMLNNSLVEPNSDSPLNSGDTVKMGSVEIQFVSIKLDSPNRETRVQSRGDPQSIAAMRAIENVATNFIGTCDFDSEHQVAFFGETINMALDQLLEGVTKLQSDRIEFQRELAEYRGESAQLDSPASTELGQKILDWRAVPDLASVKKSVNEAVEQIQRHQASLLSGLNQLLQVLLVKMSPSTIENDSVEGAGLFGRIGANKVAWKHYCDVYPELLAECSRIFAMMVEDTGSRPSRIANISSAEIFQTIQNLTKEVSATPEPKNAGDKTAK
ncbi:MAG: FHA domain-containing protein [Planctomycetota bacterium]|jgi:predicted component of type VI protein secretion system